MIDSQWHVAVLIPARNEEELLPRCLHSVLDACDVLPAKVTVDVVVAVDSSTDSTHEVAERLLGSCGVVVATNVAIVGSARSLAAETALSRYSGPLSRCWLANTDADCRVPRTWLIDQLAVAVRDIEAVAGTVNVDSFQEYRPGMDLLFRDSYLIHPDGSHPHVHGANLGVRADAYLRAGGWGNRETAEDHDLWNRLQEAGSCRRSIGNISVTTSGRRVGRAPRGFAGALTGLNEATAC
jgi:cellulose synthase/poly-beta-1,6-N-acetylglucosamine synthase-like glycosyltransferase